MILVTGGSGFIGTHLVRELCKSGHRVRNMDIRRPKEDGGEYFKGDIRKPNDCAKACEGCESVIHLAAIADVAASIEDPAGNFETNAIGTLNMIGAAAKAGSKRFVYASSAAAYGAPVSIPISENHQTAPISPYGVSKLAGEKYVLMYPNIGKIETVALRFFNVYGTGQDPKSPYSGVITKFAWAIREGGKITIFGNGKQTRDFVHVSDIVRATRLALAGNACVGKAINIGSGKGITVGEIADMMVKASGRKTEIVYRGKRGGDIEKSVADITLARSRLGFEPRIGLAQGLPELLR